jgi:hypothetical protein
MSSPPFKIRTICAFVHLSPADVTSPLSLSPLAEKVKAAVSGLNATKADLEAKNFEVQTCRIGTNSFTEYLPITDLPAFEASLSSIDDLLASLSLDFFSFGPCFTPSQTTTLAPLIVHASPRFSVSSSIPPCDIAHANAAAELVISLSTSTPGGLGNFRYCAQSSSSLGRNSPFFPAGHCASGSPFGGRIGMAFGLENGRLANEGLGKCKSLEDVGTVFHDHYAAALAPVVAAVSARCEKLGFEYVGVDTSLNPSLDAEGSIGLALESLPGVYGGVGGLGIMAAAAACTTCIQSLPFSLTGYCGVMLPVCEDHRLSLIQATPAERKYERQRSERKERVKECARKDHQGHRGCGRSGSHWGASEASTKKKASLPLLLLLLLLLLLFCGRSG